MKKKLLYIFGIISVTILSIGIILLAKGNYEWEKGIYFRKMYSYISFVDEEVAIELKYYNVLDFDDDFSNYEELYLITEYGELIKINSYNITVIETNKLYSENLVTMTIDVECGSYVFTTFRLINNGENLDFDIGEICIDFINNVIPYTKLISFSYSPTLNNNEEYEINVENISDNILILVCVKIENKFFNKINNEENIVLNPNESKLYKVEFINHELKKSDILKINPLIECKVISEEFSYYQNVSITAERSMHLSHDEVLKYVKVINGDK